MAQGNCRRREAAGREIIKSQKKSAADILSAALSLSKNPRFDKGRQPLMFNPALTTQGELPRRGKRRPPGGCASERMKTQRFSYFADFAARRLAAAGQFRPVSRGGTSCFLREAKPVKLKKAPLQCSSGASSMKKTGSGRKVDTCGWQVS